VQVSYDLFTFRYDDHIAVDRIAGLFCDWMERQVDRNERT
jgi:hypothetical protein